MDHVDREQLCKELDEVEQRVLDTSRAAGRLDAFLATSEGPDGPEPPPGFKFKPLPPGIFDPDETERRILGIPDLPSDEEK